MKPLTVKRAAGWRKQLETQQSALRRDIEKLETDVEHVVEQLADCSDSQQARLEAKLTRLRESLESKRRELADLQTSLKVATKREKAAADAAPTRRAQLKQLEAKLAELAGVALGIRNDWQAIEKRMARLREGRDEIRALRSALGLPRAESWHAFEARMVEVIAANLAYWLSRTGGPSAIAVPEPKRTLENWFSEGNWRQYLNEEAA